MSLIELKNISRSHRNGSRTVTALQQINLSIAAGEMVAITGPSGSGKSSLMNIIGCLDLPDSGDYLLNGQNTARLNPDALAQVRRETTGFIFQRYHLLPDLSALGNVEIPAIYAGMPRRQRRARAAELLGRLGLPGQEQQRPGQLSGGQQQRVSIARALINGAEIILADEPTGALDPRAGQEVLAILRELQQRGHTVIIVTHDRQVAQQAGRIVEIHDGRIVADSGTVVSVPGGRDTPRQPVRQNRWRSLLDRSRESLRMALSAMNAHRLRSLLSLSGIVFGITAVVTVVAIGEGAKQSTLDQLRQMQVGRQTLSVYAGGDFNQDASEPLLTLVPADAEAIARQPFVRAVSPQLHISQPLRYRSVSSTVSVQGVSRAFFSIENIRLLAGRNFSSDHTAPQEVIIDQNTQRLLAAEHGDVVPGATIMIGSVPLRVAGVAENVAGPALNQLSVWMPWRTVMTRMTGQAALSSISIWLKDGVDSSAASASLSQLLSQRHGVKDFMLFNRDKYRKTVEKTASTLNLLVVMVAAVALFIGSIGVMNIMLVSVTERTHEIGVRMAVGARRSDIMQQFMIEALLVCLAGGVIGILLSLITGPLLALLSAGKLLPVYDWQATLVAFLSAMLIGTLFGWLPARKAARLDPVAALASE